MDAPPVAGSALQCWAARLLEALWLAAAVAVPLAFNPWGSSAFELPKTVLLRALVLLMGLATLVCFAERRPGVPKDKRRPVLALLLPALGLGAAFALATVFSVSPRVSLWGSYERQQGLLTLGAYLGLFLLTAQHLQTRVQVERLWLALVWGSAPVLAYGLLQAAGLDPLRWRSDAASPVLSTIGRANFLGSYLVLIVPLTAGRALLAHRRWPYLLLLAGQLTCLALTQARGAWAGLAAAGVVFGLTWSLAARDRRPVLLALALLAVVVVAVALLNWPGGPLSTLARLPGLARLSTLARTDAGSTAARLTIWRAVLPLVGARPWLGYGPETLRTVFARVFPPQLVYYQGRQVAVDRAHNLALDLALSAGLAGVLAFSALLAGFARTAWRNLRAPSERFRQALWIALAAALAGHLVDLQFGFDLTASAMVVWLLLAVAASPLTPPLPLSPSPSRPFSLLSLLPYLPPALAALALVALVCVRPLRADLAYWRSQQAGRPLPERLSAGVEAVRLWPLEPAYRLGLAWLWAEGGDLDAVDVQLAAAGQLSPADPQVWSTRGNLYARWGAYGQAEMAYREALALAPDVASFHTALGWVLAQQGRLEEGLVELERAVALDATDGIAYGHLAELYRVLGREADARRAQKEAQRWGSEP